MCVILLFCFLGEGVPGYAESAQDNGPGGNINVSNYTPSEEVGSSNTHAAKTKKRNVKKNKTSDSSNRNPARKARKKMQIDSDPDMEETGGNSLARTGERPVNISGETPKNRANVFVLDSDSERNEKSPSSGIWKDDASDAEGSGGGGHLNGTTKKKLRNVILDSESDTEEISLSSLVQRDYILDAKSVTDDSSCGTPKNTVKSVTSNSSSKIEVIGTRDDETRRESKRDLSGSDSDGDILHSVKRSKTTFSADESNTKDSKKRHSGAETEAKIDVRKHKRRIILSDDEDD